MSAQGWERLTENERARYGVRDDQCDVVLSARLPRDAACLLPLPCPRHPQSAEERRKAANIYARAWEDLAARTVPGGFPHDHDARVAGCVRCDLRAMADAAPERGTNR